MSKRLFLESTCDYENEKYLDSIMDDSTITCDEIIDSCNEVVDAKSYDDRKTTLTKF